MAVHTDIEDNSVKNINIAIGGLGKNPVCLSKSIKDMTDKLAFSVHLFVLFQVISIVKSLNH